MCIILLFFIQQGQDTNMAMAKLSIFAMIIFFLKDNFFREKNLKKTTDIFFFRRKLYIYHQILNYPHKFFYESFENASADRFNQGAATARLPASRTKIGGYP